VHALSHKTERMFFSSACEVSVFGTYVDTGGAPIESVPPDLPETAGHEQKVFRDVLKASIDVDRSACDYRSCWTRVDAERTVPADRVVWRTVLRVFFGLQLYVGEYFSKDEVGAHDPVKKHTVFTVISETRIAEKGFFRNRCIVRDDS